MPLYQRRRKEVSVKWRRNKKHPRKSNIFKAWSKIEDRKAPKTFRIKKTGAKGHTYPQIYKAPKSFGEKKCKEPKPLVDILQEKDEVIVIAEVAGFKREHLRIHVKNQHLVLSGETSDRKYYKSLNLPIEVIPNNMRTVYKNGVLEIRLKKAIEEKAVDKMAG